MKRRHFLQGLLLAGSLFNSGCERLDRALAFNAIDLTGNQQFASDFRLTDHNGQTRSLADFRGKVVTLFFGYLNCPDFCPMHLVRQNEVLQLLGKDAARVQTLFVSVDPERDTPERIKAYVTAFHASNLGLTGSKAELDATVQGFKASYRKVDTPDSALAYTVDHSTLSYAFDPQGRLRLAIRHELTPQQVADDLRQLLAKP